jgi:TetR/AcrR family transcriptional regulator, regulator of autoinduction and epiphytic fitness
MSSPPLTRRRYASPRRAAAAAATRTAVLDAALDLFLERGYASTTMDAIAARANVSPKTVYALLRNRRGLLRAVLDRAIAGDEAPISIAERPWVADMRASTDQAERLAILGREGARILQRRSAIDAVLDQAALIDADAAELATSIREERRVGQAALLRLALTPREVDDAAADVLFAIGSPEVYRTLTAGRGWTHAAFEAWYIDLLQRVFLTG